VDEHYYSDPAFFINNASKYDGYNRNGPKIYVGEYAVTSGSGSGNLRGALAEAAFMTGMERNSDVVVMSSYAPLFANLNYKRWNPDLIYFDSSRVTATPSYHVQRLFAHHRGDVVIPATVEATIPEPSQLRQGAVGVGSWNTQVEYTNVVVTSNGVTLFQSDFNEGSAGWQVYKGTWSTSSGLYRQTAIDTDCRATAGSTTWSNYTLRLKARKTGGQEGFLILFNWLNNDNWTWWNLGGWNNTRHAIENCENGTKSVLGSQVNGQIETGRWYDIRIELSGRTIRCFLDDQLVQEASYPPPRQGAIGLGTWSTRASFTNVVVTRGTQKLYQSDFSSGAPGWTTSGGTWSTADRLYRQTSLNTNCRSTTGDTTWSDYTLELRARKDSGNEGFLIIFNWLDSNNWTWWNLGGWNNTSHAIEVSENGTKRTLSPHVSGSIETGRWYDIRVELSGSRIRCYLDNQLIHDISYSSPKLLHASASYHEATGQIILKLVNVSAYDIAAAIELAGVGGLHSKANWILLTSGSASDENTLEQPDKVAPVSGTITNAGTNFTYGVPANSLTVLRLQAPSPPTTRVGLQVSENLNDLANYPNGIPVGLSSFITSPMAVDYIFENQAGDTVATGTVQFSPGDIALRIPVPENSAGLLRLTLRNPVACELDTNWRAYFVTAGANAPMDLQMTAYADESLVYWTSSSATLTTATNASGPWTPEPGTVPPIRIPRDRNLEFFRLMK
jgi:alpha-L-arabinofuranosidase